MKLKKFEKVVKYYILKHQKSILSDAMEKGVEYCKKNIEYWYTITKVSLRK